MICDFVFCAAEIFCCINDRSSLGDGIEKKRATEESERESGQTEYIYIAHRMPKTNGSGIDQSRKI